MVHLEKLVFRCTDYSGQSYFMLSPSFLRKVTEKTLLKKAAKTWNKQERVTRWETSHCYTEKQRKQKSGKPEAK